MKSKSYDRAAGIVRLIGVHGKVSVAVTAALARYDATRERETKVPARDLVVALRAADPSRQTEVIAACADRRRQADAFESAVRAGLWTALEADLALAVDDNLPQIRALLARAVARAETALRYAAEAVVGVMDAVPGTPQAEALYKADAADEVLLTYGEVWPDLRLHLTSHRYTPNGLDLTKFATTPEPGVLSISARTLTPMDPKQAARSELVQEVCREFAMSPARALVRITRGDYPGCELAWAENPDTLLRRANALADAHETRRVNQSLGSVGT